MRPTNIPSRPHTYTLASRITRPPRVCFYRLYRLYRRRRANLCGRARAPTCNRLLIKFEWLMPQKHIKTWMSTDENLVARNQETAEANGLAAAHTRGRNLRLHHPPPPLPFARRHPASFPLSFAIGYPSKYNYSRKTLGDCYIRRPEALASGRIPQRKQPMHSVGFRRSFFQPIDELPGKIMVWSGKLFRTWFW